MLKQIILAALLILTNGFIAVADENCIIQILAIAKENNISDKQVAIAIESGITPEEFSNQITGMIRIVAPDKATVGSPVLISVEGISAKSTVLWQRYPVTSGDDVFLELYDKNNNPVNIFWSSTGGTRTFMLIVAENGLKTPTIEIATHTLAYGSGPGPTPDPIVVPTPSQELQILVEPLVVFTSRVEKADLLNLTEFYFDFADIIRRDNSDVVTTTDVFRSTYIKAGNLMFQQTGMKGKYAGLAEITDGIIMDYLGEDVRASDATRTADVLNAVAWAFAGGK